MDTTIRLRYPWTGIPYRILSGEEAKHALNMFPLTGVEFECNRREEDWKMRRMSEHLASNERFKNSIAMLYRLRERDRKWRQSRLYHLWLAWQEIKAFFTQEGA